MGVVRHVVCAMSGGVDSSVAALLLKRRGEKFVQCYDLILMLREQDTKHGRVHVVFPAVTPSLNSGRAGK